MDREHRGLKTREAPETGAVLGGGPSVLTVDLDAVRANYRLLAASSFPASVSAVVKADAYGLGMEPVARALAEEGCDFFYCFSLAEALKLRAVLPKVRIAYFAGPFSTEDCALSFAADVLPVLNTREQLAFFAAFAKGGSSGAPFAVHIDTGMRRFGFSWRDADALRAELAAANLLGSLALVISHMACADEPDHEENPRQLARMQALKSLFPGKELSLANSSGAFLGKEYRFDRIRPGAGLYGVHPHPGAGRANPLRPAVRLETRVCQIRDGAESGTVGYGASVAPAGAVLACLPLGYADGLPRSLSASGEAHAYAEGVRCPYVGRISMDTAVVDVSAVPAPLRRVGMKVEIFGDAVPAERFAAWADTIPYEIYARIGARVRREYVDAGGLLLG
jgi:alanine racemase